MNVRSAIGWSFAYVEGAAVSFAVAVPTLLLLATLLGVAGARAQGIAPPPVDLTALWRMHLVLLFSLCATSVPTALVLGVCAGRLRARRRALLLLVGAGCLCFQALLTAYPFAAFSPYFLSNTPPRAAFPFGADWSVPLPVVVLFAYFGLVVLTFLLGPLFVGAIWLLERRTRLTDPPRRLGARSDPDALMALGVEAAIDASLVDRVDAVARLPVAPRARLLVET